MSLGFYYFFYFVNWFRSGLVGDFSGVLLLNITEPYKSLLALGQFLFSLLRRTCNTFFCLLRLKYCWNLFVFHFCRPNVGTYYVEENQWSVPTSSLEPRMVLFITRQIIMNTKLKKIICTELICESARNFINRKFSSTSHHFHLKSFKLISISGKVH